jgi:hypothetical protein
MEKVFEYLPKILDSQRYIRRAGTDRDVQPVSSIPKPELMTKTKGGDSVKSKI